MESLLYELFFHIIALVISDSKEFRNTRLVSKYWCFVATDIGSDSYNKLFLLPGSNEEKITFEQFKNCAIDDILEGLAICQKVGYRIWAKIENRLYEIGSIEDERKYFGCWSAQVSSFRNLQEIKENEKFKVELTSHWDAFHNAFNKNNGMVICILYDENELIGCLKNYLKSDPNPRNIVIRLHNGIIRSSNDKNDKTLISTIDIESEIDKRLDHKLWLCKFFQKYNQ